MKNKTAMQIATVMGFMLTGTMQAWAGTAVTEACLANSGKMIDSIARADYADAASHFSPGSKSASPAELEQVWNSAEHEMGEYSKHLVPRQFSHYDRIAVVEMQFARMKQDLMVGCNKQGQLDWHRLVDPVKVDLAQYEAVPHAQAGRVDANGVRVVPLNVPSPAGPLFGALTLPSGHGPFPVVVMVAGSGPHDRDERIGPNVPFRDIAEGLAERGVATLRYDKRNFDHKEWKGTYVIDTEVTDDAVEAIRELSTQKEIDSHHIFVLGHSLGGQLAGRIALRSGRAAGLVLMAAPARRVLDVLTKQARDLSQKANASPEALQKAVAEVEGEKKLLAGIKPGKPLPTGTYMGGSHAYWLNWSRVDSVADVKAAGLPTLIMQGGDDFQVSPQLDFDHWKAVAADRKDVAFRSYPGLGHMFTPAGKTGTLADYVAPAHVPSDVIEDIAAWVKATQARQPDVAI